MKKFQAFLLSSFLVSGLSGCMTRMNSDHLDQAAAQQTLENFVDGMIHSNLDQISANASLPFWVEERWLEDAESFKKELAGEAPEDFEGFSLLKVKLYPLSDLEVLMPKVWEQLKQSPRLYFKDLYLGSVVMQEKAEPTPRQGFMLLRWAEGQWKIAGLIDK